MGEKLVLDYLERIPSVIIRISETYGPGDHRLLKLFKGIQKNIFFVIGKGENLHHLIYVDDLIDGLFLAATSDNAVGEIFVFAGRESLTTNQVAEEIAGQLGTRIPKIHVPLSLSLGLATITERVLRPFGIQPPLHRRRMDFFRKSFFFSQEKSLNVLGFQSKVSFSQGVAETLKWYKEMGYM